MNSNERGSGLPLPKHIADTLNEPPCVRYMTVTPPPPYGMSAQEWFDATVGDYINKRTQDAVQSGGTLSAFPSGDCTVSIEMSARDSAIVHHLLKDGGFLSPEEIERTGALTVLGEVVEEV